MEHRLNILIAEDQPLIAFLVEELLADIGLHQVTTVESNTAAVAAIEDASISAAFLDCSLADGDCQPTIDALTSAGIPFVIISGHASHELAERFPDRPIVTKPFTGDAIGRALRKILPIRV